jgi:hypothetical protein
MSRQLAFSLWFPSNEDEELNSPPPGVSETKSDSLGQRNIHYLHIRARKQPVFPNLRHAAIK